MHRGELTQKERVLTVSTCVCPDVLLQVSGSLEGLGAVLL